MKLNLISLSFAILIITDLIYETKDVSTFIKKLPIIFLSQYAKSKLAISLQQMYTSRQKKKLSLLFLARDKQHSFGT